MNKIITILLIAVIFSCVLVSSLPTDGQSTEDKPRIFQKRCKGIGCFFVGLGFPDMLNEDWSIKGRK